MELESGFLHGVVAKVKAETARADEERLQTERLRVREVKGLTGSCPSVWS